MAVLAQAAAFLATLTAILHLFRIFPVQYNAKIAAHGLLSAATVLFVLLALISGRFSNVAIGVLSLLAAAASLLVSVAYYRNDNPRRTTDLVAIYAVVQVLVLVLLLGSSAVGALR